MDLTQDSAFTLTQDTAYEYTAEGEGGETEQQQNERKSNDNDNKKRRKRKRDRVYEQLGAPCLLYRNANNPSLGLVEEDDYLCSGPKPPWTAIGTSPRSGDIHPALQTQLIHGSMQRLHRTQARWYYPMDYSILKSTLMTDDHWGNINLDDAQKKAKKKKEKLDLQWATALKSARQQRGAYKTNNDSKAKESELHAKTARLKSGEGDCSNKMRDKELLDSRVFGGAEEARSYMLETSFFEDDNELEQISFDEEIKKRPRTVGKLQEQYHTRILRGHKKYDHPYFPARWVKDWYSGDHVMHLPIKRFKGSLHFSEQRRDRADPDRLAPVPCESLYETLEDDKTKKWEFEKSAPLPFDDPNHPSKYGNCLLCFTCSCPPCSANSEAGDQPTWCLLHPIGELLNKLTVSTLCTPQGTGNAAMLRIRRNMDSNQKQRQGGKQLNELDVGDAVLQIAQCGGRSTFLARTAIHVTVFSVSPQKETYTTASSGGKRRATSLSTASNDSDRELCWGILRIAELQRIDLRSFAKHGPSYCPVDMTCHPRFGNTAWNHKHKFAILSYSKRNQDRNIIHHFLWSMEEKTAQVWSAKGKKKLKTTTVPDYHVTKHTISNLKAISEISFSPAHPMVLWAVAKSYVRPALAPDFSTRIYNVQPRLGQGYSLFTIDLRTNQATFQWSPSAEEFLSEGVHSISGIAPEWHDPNRRNVVWVSSVSAGKMWEIDGRVPCRVINMWSLPSQCDECGPTLPAIGGLYGAGTIIAWPNEAKRQSSSSDAPSDLPVLSVGKAPDTYGLHLYQRPKNPPRFQTQGIECAASTALHNWAGKKSSIVMSSVFALPDVSDRVFTCGLAPLRLPVSEFLTKSAVSSLECNIERTASMICVITITNRGDVYTHSLLEVRPDKNQHFSGPKAADGLPVGSTMIPVPLAAEVNDEIKQRNTEDGISNKEYRTEQKVAEKKLAGGMNLHLQLSNNLPLPRERALATVNAKSQADVRPFKYSNLRQMPAQEHACEGGSPTRRKEVRPHGTINDVIVCTREYSDNCESGSSVVLPDTRRNPQREQFFSTPECFHSSQESTSAGLPGADNGTEQVPRSDVTNEILDFVDEDWK